MCRFTLILALVLISHGSSLRAEDADSYREKGILALKESQTNPTAIVEAARNFAKASELYNALGNDEKSVEMNSFLFWCKKKMTLDNIEAFTKGGETVVTNRLAAVDKLAPKVDEAQKWFDRADQFAKKNPGEHLLIAVRFFEVADRFKGSEASLQAQDRSLKEMLQDKSSGARSSAPPVVVRAPETAAASTGSKAIPPADSIKKAEKLIKDLFKNEYAQTDAAGRSALAAKLLQQAEESKSDAAAEYALFCEARDSAVLGGDAAQAQEAQRRLRDSFKLDFAALLLDLRRLEASAKSGDAAAALAHLYLQGADDAMAADNFDQAARYGARAEELLPLIKDAELKARMKSEIPRVQALKRESVAALAALKTLATKPDDPEANLTAGEFALLRGDCEKAFALLAKGKDGALAGLAKRELASVAEAAEQVSLADGWYERADKEAAPLLKVRMEERAALWYGNSLPALTGLTKLKVEGRLKKLPAVKAPERIAASSARNGPGLLNLVDLRYDTVRGNWSRTPSGLRSQGGGWSMIQIPTYPPAEYDFKFEFTREGKSGDMGFIVVMNNHQALVTLCGGGNRFAGLERIDRKLTEENPTRTENSLIQGRRYAVVAEVRETGIRVSLDGKQLFEFKTDGSNLDLHDHWVLHDSRVMALGAYDTSVTFHNASIVDVSGKSESALERRRSAHVGGTGGGYFEDLPKDSVLVGFKVSWKGGDKDIVDSVQPVYLGADGKTTDGKIHGPVRGPVHELIAKPGYAVGGISARGYDRVAGFKVVFMKLGAVLNPNDSYESEWVGGLNGRQINLEATGRVIGIYGRKANDLDQFGLIFKPAEAFAPIKPDPALVSALPRVKVVKVSQGANGNIQDETEFWASQLDGNPYGFLYDNWQYPDPAPGVAKPTTAELLVNGVAQTFTVHDGEPMVWPWLKNGVPIPAAEFKVYSAQWGAFGFADVTKQIRDWTADPSVVFQIGWENFSIDPSPGRAKFLVIFYSYERHFYMKSFREGATVKLAETSTAPKTPGRWISKDATYTVSSMWPELRPSLPNLLNGVGGGWRPNEPMNDMAFSTENQDDPWIVIDLKQAYDLSAVQIVPRRNLLNRACPMIMYKGDSEDGPWTEIWRTEKRLPQYDAAISGKAQFLKIIRMGHDHFHLFSVKVFGQ